MAAAWRQPARCVAALGERLDMSLRDRVGSGNQRLVAHVERPRAIYPDTPDSAIANGVVDRVGVVVGGRPCSRPRGSGMRVLVDRVEALDGRPEVVGPAGDGKG
jgi:hypothetical protein